MILIPQRLFASPGTKTILRDGNVCILSKELTEPVIKREGYISNHVVSVVLAGEQHIRTYEDELIKVQANDILFAPRGMYYISDLLPADGTFKSLLFYFDDSVIHNFLSNSRVDIVDRQAAPSYLKFGVLPTVRLFADSLIDIYQHQQIRDKNFLQLKILELLHLLNHQAQEKAFANFLFRLTLPQKRNIKTFMQQNYDKPLKVEDYAYLTGRSLSTFRRDFKSAFDRTPQQWLKEQRLQKALELVSQKEISVTQLAYEVGYENISYFIKAFKAQVGLSPKQYMLAQHRNSLKH